MPKKPAKTSQEIKFRTYKPEYGTKIVKNKKKGKLVSPARKEEVFNARHKFSSKAKGLKVLLNSIRMTGAKFLGYTYFSPNKISELSDNSLMKILTRKGTRILVRSDNTSIDSAIGMRERISQPRASFPNNSEGRKEAITLMKELNKHYGVIIHHIRKPQNQATGHGRVFIQGKTGTVWVYFAERDSSTSTFSRWNHRLVIKKSSKTTQEGEHKNAINKKAINACLNLAENIKKNSYSKEHSDIISANFVVYKGEENNPEFYDLLFVHGMKRPGFRSF